MSTPVSKYPKLLKTSARISGWKDRKIVVSTDGKLSMAASRDGSFVTSEKGLVRVKIYSATGEFQGVVVAAKDFEKGIHGLDLAVDSKDRVLVADPGTSTVRIYSVKTGESHP